MSNVTGLRYGRRGSVLILVVALLAVLFVTGMGFLSMTAIDRVSSTASEDNAALAIEADAIVQRIIGELGRDLWGSDNVMLSGNGGNEGWDYPCTNGDSFGVDDDAWLACILPETHGNDYKWRHISNFSGQAGSDTNVLASELEDAGQADTDLDGVCDARWVYSPTGRYRYAVRVIDLNGMINLNTAGRGFPDDDGSTPYHVAAAFSNVQRYWGPYYARDGDSWILFAGGNQNNQRIYGRGTDMPYTGYNAYGNGRLDENPNNDYSMWLDDPFIRTSGRYPNAMPFRTHDTLALMAYGVKAGPVAARIAVGWPETFRTSRNRIPNIRANSDGPLWDNSSFRLYYTTHGWTRNLRSNESPAAAVLPPPGGAGDAVSWWQNLLSESLRTLTGDGARDDANRPIGKVPINYPDPHASAYTRALVAAMVLSGSALTQPQIEQLVVNLADWRDGDQDVSTTGLGGGAGRVDTVWNTAGIYGNEPQVFITEVGAYLSPDNPDTNCFALELFNPYRSPVDITHWQIRCAGADPMVFEVAGSPTARIVLQAGDRRIVRNATQYLSGGARPRPTPWAAPSDPRRNPGMTDGRLKFTSGGTTPDIVLLRPQHADGSGDLLAVDRVSQANVRSAIPQWLQTGDNPASGVQHAHRGDSEWQQSRDEWKDSPGKATTWGIRNTRWGPTYVPVPHRAGREAAMVLPLPVYDPRRPAGDTVNDFTTLGQLHWLMVVGPEGADGEPVTAKITAATTADQVSNLYLNYSNVARGDRRVLRDLVRLDRRFNGQDNNGDGTPDNLSEIRLAGQININTATPHVLRYLNYYLFAAEGPNPAYGGGAPVGWRAINTYDAWDVMHAAKTPTSYFDFNVRIYDYREAIGGFRDGIAALMNVPKMSQTGYLFTQLVFPKNIPGIYGTQGLGQWNYSVRNSRAELRFFYTEPPGVQTDSQGNPTFPIPNPWFHDQAAWNDLNEKLFIFDRISDLATTRSDTFLAYILVQEIDTGSGSTRVARQRRMVTIIDRSRCNVPPSHDDYVPPEVVARSVTTW